MVKKKAASVMKTNNGPNLSPSAKSFKNTKALKSVRLSLPQVSSRDRS